MSIPYPIILSDSEDKYTPPPTIILSDSDSDVDMDISSSILGSPITPYYSFTADNEYSTSVPTIVLSDPDTDTEDALPYFYAPDEEVAAQLTPATNEPMETDPSKKDEPTEEEPSEDDSSEEEAEHDTPATPATPVTTLPTTPPSPPFFYKRHHEGGVRTITTARKSVRLPRREPTIDSPIVYTDIPVDTTTPVIPTNTTTSAITTTTPAPRRRSDARRWDWLPTTLQS